MSLNRRGTAVPFRPQGHNSRHTRQAIILPGSRQDKPSDSRCSVSALLYRRSNIVLVVTCRSCEDDWKAARAKTCLACGSDRHRSGQSPHFAHTPPISITSAIPIFLRTKGNAMPIPGFVECLLVAIWLYPWVFCGPEPAGGHPRLSGSLVAGTAGRPGMSRLARPHGSP